MCRFEEEHRVSRDIPTSKCGGLREAECILMVSLTICAFVLCHAFEVFFSVR